jgi:hypothetical protein
MTPPRRLIALDEDDLAVISAHVQDAHVRVADIVWRQDQNRLVIGMRRPDLDKAMDGETSPCRLIAALRFDRVLACRARNIDPAARDAVFELIGVEFQPGQPPGGTATLYFSGGGLLQLDLECVECELANLCPDTGV